MTPKSPALQKLLNRGRRGNPLERLAQLEQQSMGEFLRTPSADKLTEITGDLGFMVSGAFISPVAGTVSTEPTSTDFIGAFMCGTGFAFGASTYQIGGANAGVLQWGAGTDGKLYAGAGAVTLDADGIKIVSPASAYGAETSIKWYIDTVIGGQISAYKETGSDATNYATNMRVYSLSGGTLADDGELQLVAENGSDNASIALYSNGNIETLCTGNLGINSIQLDSNTTIKGVTTTIATFDAGLEGLGLGGAAEAGKILKATGDVHITGATDIDDAVTIGGAATLNGNVTLGDAAADIITVNGKYAAGQWNRVYKASSESRQSDTALTADSDLAFVATASKTYAIRGRVWFNTPAAADFKYRLTFAGTTLYAKHTWIPCGSSTETVAVAVASPIDGVPLGAGTTGGYVEFDGRIVCDGSNRSMIFQWAQNTSTASNTTVLSGSYMEYMQVN